MYDVYQWEAHPNSNFVASATLEQKIGYYEAYRDQYNMTLPCLIDDDDQSFGKLYETYSPENNKLREYTAIWVIDFEGIVIYKSAWISPGVWSKDGRDPYPPLDDLLEDLLATKIDYDNIKVINNQNVSCFSTHGAVYLQLPEYIQYSLGVYNLEGKCIVTSAGRGSSVFNVGDRLSSGKYVIRINTEKNNYTSPLIINK